MRNNGCTKNNTDLQKQGTKYVERYCAYCKKLTWHEVVSSQKNSEGTGGDLRCVVCRSSRLDTIQGFDAALM